jgi:gamma-glutamylcyclotransferase (GGCT)/AIG2-like uncharacterized protein YtfP
MKRIAVYGSLRKGEYNHQGEFAKQAVHINTGLIHGAELVGGHAYPWLLESDDEDSSVVAEVYDIPDDTFNWIEAMEVGAGYERRPVQVVVGAVKMDADAYFFATPDALDEYPRITSGDWAKREQQK